MRTLLVAGALAAGVIASPGMACNDHAPGTEPVPKRVQKGSLASAEVLEVDVEENVVTLKHGRIASLRMPAMGSMRFKVGDAALLAGLAAGDRIRFRAMNVGAEPTLVEIVRLK
jgi:Cu/Ag efflux protein CusF